MITSDLTWYQSLSSTNKSRPNSLPKKKKKGVVSTLTQGPMCEEEIVGLSHIIGCGKCWWSVYKYEEKSYLFI
jgi:hypothetical protein